MEEATKEERYNHSAELKDDESLFDASEDEESFMTAYFGQDRSEAQDSKIIEQNEVFSFPNSVAEQKSLSIVEDLAQQQLNSHEETQSLKDDRRWISNYEKIFNQNPEIKVENVSAFNFKYEVARRQSSKNIQIDIDHQECSKTLQIEEELVCEDTMNLCFSRLSVENDHKEAEDNHKEEKKQSKSQPILYQEPIQELIAQQEFKQNYIRDQQETIIQSEAIQSPTTKLIFSEVKAKKPEYFKTIPISNGNLPNERPQRHRTNRLEYWTGEKIVYKNRIAQYEIKRKSLIDLLFNNQSNQQSIKRHQIFQWKQRSVEGQIEICKKSSVEVEMTDEIYQFITIRSKRNQLILNDTSNQILIKDSLQKSKTHGIRLNLLRSHLERIHNCTNFNVKLIIIVNSRTQK